jgi:uncharacterized protein YjbI with pentapeptide repeats
VCPFTGAKFVEANLGGAVLAKALAPLADFRGAILVDTDFSGAVLAGADFTDADLTGANFTGANVTDANFTGVDRAAVNLTNAITNSPLFSPNGEGEFVAECSL